jgi:hypothetical protein
MAMVLNMYMEAKAGSILHALKKVFTYQRERMIFLGIVGWVRHEKSLVVVGKKDGAGTLKF